MYGADLYGIFTFIWDTLYIYQTIISLVTYTTCILRTRGGYRPCESCDFTTNFL